MASKKEPLSVTHPELAAQAHGWDPTTLTQRSNKTVGWKCSFGHSWTARVANRTLGTGCPVCANKSVLVGFNDLATTNPELATEADGWDPTTLTAGSHNRRSWKCRHGHTWMANVEKRLSGQGCPFCSGRRVLAGFNDLATTNPELATEADGWDPTTLTANSNKEAAWRCNLGHRWTTTIAGRNRGNGCSVCANQSVLVGFNDLATTNPELATEADGWDPTTLTAGSGKVVGWKCSLGHTWTSTVTGRDRGNGCSVCGNKSVLVGFNDLATTNPELATEADGWDPTTLTAGSGKVVGWKCSLGHTWKAKIYHRTNGVGCAVCSGHAVLAGFNDLATTNPELATEADGWDPTTLTAGSGKVVGWKCSLGHTWTSTIDNRSKGKGCPTCSNKLVLLGFNDLNTTHPAIAAQAYGWEPTNVTAGSNKKVAWTCNVGHTWKTTVASRVRGSGCPGCAKYGFDPSQEAWLYLIEHDTLGMFQIGISNVLEQRLSKHTRRGWEVLEVRGPMDGRYVKELETAMLNAILRRGGVLGHQANIDKFDGYSEAWTKESLMATSFKQLLDWVYEDDSDTLVTD
jgi:hypothetical protein